MCDINVQSGSLWDERDRKKNSTFRELKAILFALQSFCSHLRNEKVKVFSNSQNAVRIIHVGIAVNCGHDISVVFERRLSGFLETKIRRRATFVELLIPMTGSFKLLNILI